MTPVVKHKPLWFIGIRITEADGTVHNASGQRRAANLDEVLESGSWEDLDGYDQAAIDKLKEKGGGDNVVGFQINVRREGTLG